MLNKRLTIGILVVLNAILFCFMAVKYGLGSVNNWLMIVSCGLLSLGVYRVLGMVEGYKK
jgi:hypothetical protein